MDEVLRRRERLRARSRTTSSTQWTVAAHGHGFTAVDQDGRRAVGRARGAAAVTELLATLTAPGDVPRLHWTTEPPPAPTGRLNGCDEGRLDPMRMFVAATPAARQQLRAALPAIRAAWNADRIESELEVRVLELNRSHPVVPSSVPWFTPYADGRVELGRVRAYDWIRTDTVVGGGVESWNGFGDHRSDTVPWIIRQALTSRNPEGALLRVLTDDRGADVERIAGPAGPIHVVSNGGRHRTHAMRILGVPVMVVEVAAYGLPVLIDEHLAVDDADPVSAEPIWRGLMRRGLLQGDIVRTATGVALQPYDVVAPWLLLHPDHAAVISAAYERIYPGALAIPPSAMRTGDAWYRWSLAR